MKFKIVSMLIVLGLLSVMPLIYTGKLDPAKFFDKVNLDTGDLSNGISQLKTKVPGVGGSDEVKVYKWRDANGAMQFGSYPPPGVSTFEQMSVDTNKNVVNAVKVPVKEEKESEQVSQDISAPSPYSIKGMKKVIDDAKGVEDMLKKSHDNQEKVIQSL